MRNRNRAGLFDPRMSGQVWPEPNPDTNIPYVWSLGKTPAVGAPISETNALPDLTNSASRRLNARMHEMPLSGGSWAEHNPNADTPGAIILRYNGVPAADSSPPEPVSDTSPEAPKIKPKDKDIFTRDNILWWLLVSQGVAMTLNIYNTKRKGKKLTEDPVNSAILAGNLGIALSCIYILNKD